MQFTILDLSPNKPYRASFGTADRRQPRIQCLEKIRCFNGKEEGISCTSIERIPIREKANDADYKKNCSEIANSIQEVIDLGEPILVWQPGAFRDLALLLGYHAGRGINWWSTPTLGLKVYALLLAGNLGLKLNHEDGPVEAAQTLSLETSTNERSESLLEIIRAANKTGEFEI